MKDRIKLLAVLALSTMLLTMLGCQACHQGGYADANKVQLQFYAPASAEISVTCNTQQVSAYQGREHRLESQNDSSAVYNLKPGKYEFSYNSAGGWPQTAIYGSLEVCKLNTKEMPDAKNFIRRSFIPVALPSPATAEIQPAGDDVFPYQSAPYRLRINHHDVKRLAEGDMITKVVFLADLEQCKNRLDEVTGQLVVLDREMEYTNKRYREERYDWIEDAKSKKFIEREAKRQALERQIEQIEQEKTRLSALLEGDQVLIRDQMLVLATDEVLPPHENPVAAAEQLGQVVLVMRVGGRHLQTSLAGQ